MTETAKLPLESSDFIKEKARVVSLEGEFAWIEAESKSGCQSCEVKQGCGTGLLSQLFGRRVFHHKVKNTLDVEVGDLILVSVPQSGLLLASLVMYCLPLTMLILVAMVAEAATSFPEPVIVILSFAGLLLGLLMSRYLSKRLERSVSASVNMVCKLDPQLMLQTE